MDRQVYGVPRQDNHILMPIIVVFLVVSVIVFMFFAPEEYNIELGEETYYRAICKPDYYQSHVTVTRGLIQVKCIKRDSMSSYTKVVETNE